jgi:hypothetical protein
MATPLLVARRSSLVDDFDCELNDASVLNGVTLIRREDTKGNVEGEKQGRTEKLGERRKRDATHSSSTASVARRRRRRRVSSGLDLSVDRFPSSSFCRHAHVSVARPTRLVDGDLVARAGRICARQSVVRPAARRTDGCRRRCDVEQQRCGEHLRSTAAVDFLRPDRLLCRRWTRGHAPVLRSRAAAALSSWSRTSRTTDSVRCHRRVRLRHERHSRWSVGLFVLFSD